MSSVLYLGEVPKANQSIPEALSSKGINLIPTAPSKIIATIYVEDHQPNHDLFIQNLPAFVTAAESKNAVQISHRWRPLQRFNTPVYAKQPLICWSYPSRVPADFVNGLRGWIPGLQETVIKGKAALIGYVEASKISDLKKDGALETTANNITSLNISGFRSYLTAHRMIDAILRTNQYPYKESGNGPYVKAFDERVGLVADLLGLKQVKATTGGNDYEELLVRSSDYRARCNLAVEYSKFETTVITKSDLPPDHSGLLLPFDSQLSTPDYTTIPSFFRRYCMGFFGHNGADAVQGFEQFKSGAGALAGTKWGDELAHLCWSVDVGMRAQATIRVWTDEQSNYMGCVVLGGGFTINLKERVFTPQAHSTLCNDISQSTPHQRAIETILNSLFTDPMDVGAARANIHSTHDLRRVIYSVGLTEARILIIRSQLRLLSFPGQVPFLTPTSANIKRVLTHLMTTDFAMDVTLPLHPSMIICDDRDTRIWSAFGLLAPSFLVPGGKAMALQSSFEVQEKNAQGLKETRHVTKVGVILKTLDQAAADLATVKSSRIIHNPHGSAVMNRVSSDSIIRSFEKDAAGEVLGALRTYCGVSVTNTAGAPGKRKREDEDEGAAKRARITEF